MAAGRSRSRRVSLPGVAELLRPAAPGPDGGDQRRASGREKHTQKITVYLSAEELLDLERARLALLRYGAAADRGRIVREAIAVLLADLDARGKDSLLARRIVSANKAAQHRGRGQRQRTPPAGPPKRPRRKHRAGRHTSLAAPLTAGRTADSRNSATVMTVNVDDSVDGGPDGTARTPVQQSAASKSTSTCSRARSTCCSR